MQIPVTTSGRIHPYHPNMRPRLFFRLDGSVSSPQFSSYCRRLLHSRAGLCCSYQYRRADARCLMPAPKRICSGPACPAPKTSPVRFTSNSASVAPDGRKIFLAGNLHSTSATLASVLLQSDDARRHMERTSRAHPRERARSDCSFTICEHGWAAGETQYPLPRDPFFLMTTDGGASWRQHLVGEEGSAGVGPALLVRFRAARRTDRRCGQERPQAAAIFPTNPKPAAKAGHCAARAISCRSSGARRRRLRIPTGAFAPAKDGKAYQIEQRAGEQVDAVASFLIEVANCQMQPA